MTAPAMPPVEWFHCLRCDADVPASEVDEYEWMPGRLGRFHVCGDWAHPAWWAHPDAPASVCECCETQLPLGARARINPEGVIICIDCFEALRPAEGS